jgi:pilus assembly protein CpaF
MFTVVITEKEGAERRLTFSESEVTVGRVPGNDVVLPKGNVSKRHSRIVLKDNRFIVVDLKSTNGTYVNGRKITSPLVVKDGDKIYVGDFVLTLESDPAASVPLDAMRPPSIVPSQQLDVSRSRPELAVAGPPSSASAQAAVPSEERVPAVLRTESIANDGGRNGTGELAIEEPTPNPKADEDLRSTLAQEQKRAMSSGQVPVNTSAVLETGLSRSREHQPPAAPVKPTSKMAHEQAGVRATKGDLRALLSCAAQELTRQAQLVSHDEAMRRNELERALAAKVSELVTEGVLARDVDRPALLEAALRELGGLGPLEGLLADPAISQIVVERFDRIYAERGQGLTEQRGLSFSTPESLLLAARRLLAQADISEAHGGSYDVMLPSGLHVVCFLAATTDGPVLSLQRRLATRVRLDQLVERGTLLSEQAQLLSTALAGQRPIWVVGPDAQAHASLLAALLGEVPADERVALCERVPEVSFEPRSCIALRLLPGNLPELVERGRHVRVRRFFLQDLREEDLKVALLAFAKGNAGHVASMESASPERALLALRRAGGVDVTLRAVSVMVTLAPDAELGAKVSSVAEVELDEAGELALKALA